MRFDAYDVVREVTRIAATPAGVAQRAEALLTPIRRLVPFTAARLYLLDMPRRAKHPLVSTGYDERVLSFLNSPAHLDLIELLGLGRPGPPMRLRDLPVPRERIHGWTEYLAPAGFREAMMVRLTTLDGRYLGILGLNTDSTAHPTDTARDVLGALAPVIAAAVDPLRSITAAARLLDGAIAGTLLARDGSTQPLPGLPGHPVLSAGSRLLKVAADQLKAMRRTSFLCPYDCAGRTDLLHVTVLTGPRVPPSHVIAALVVSRPQDLHRLTRRELGVLGLVIDGCANRQIAKTLRLTEATVNTHLEHIRAKLDTPSRTLAAVRALHQGLYIPLPLN